ncbi:MAG: UDP-N-acetylglucosamine 1-carboxyvinyltransferase [Eubacteriales bacterium]|nr:UDP-N-acetylglucosamine 1-carboxyvinyltransferase [Eubacteriales bacterium]
MDDKLVINGGKPLSGEIHVSGSKNSAVAVLAAALLCEGVCVVENLPTIEDVVVLKSMMEALGAKVELDGSTARIDASDINRYHAPIELVRKMRASNYLIGALLGRLGRAQVGIPGGCDIGTRPMDLHEKGLRALGASMALVRGEYVCNAKNLIGAEIYLDHASVGATINIMLAACKAQGRTVIVNAAREPHVVDVANFLGSMGANIKGAGTDTIRIRGVAHLHGSRYSILPDMIETGTWMAIAAATKGDITIRDCVPFHMESVSAKLEEMGMYVEEGEDYLRVKGTGRPRPVSITTMVYPGFPTDLQQPFAVLLSVASGHSVINETIYESRYKYIDELRRMGAEVRVMDRIAMIDGVEALWGTEVSATDLRAGAALVVAGLMADGTTSISNVKYIDRGYEHITEKLVSLGADVRRIREG